MGLISRVVPHDELRAAARAAAHQVLRTAPAARQQVKRMLSERYGLVDYQTMFWDLEHSPEPREGMRAFMEKRPPSWIPSDVPSEDREREERIAVEQAADRPENVRDRVVSGKIDKWLDDVVLLRQKHVNEDKYGGKTIDELRAALASETGENVVIRRFARFAVGD